MLTKILSRAECAKCQICCSFDSYDLWETPVITDEVQSLALEIAPQQKFSYASGARLFSYGARAGRRPLFLSDARP